MKSAVYSDNVLVFRRSDPDIGYVARTATRGQELDMVEQYIRHLRARYSKLRTKKAAVFLEPQLDTGYPDLVIVEYFSLPSKKWNNARSSLTATDLKILYHIQTRRRITAAEISRALGYPASAVEKSLRRLREADLLRPSGGSLCSAPLHSYCRIHKIIAIEAKIDKWQEAIRQANQNIWFATESYILMNRESCPAAAAEKCAAGGIGIILGNERFQKILPAARRPFPVSYASLQFNEWLLRYINRQEDKL